MTDFLSTRIINAPRAAVFRACSDPALLARWWGPRGFTNVFEEFDPRPGGAWRFVMHGPDGSRHRINNEFVEWVPLERIVVRHVQEMHNFDIALTFADAASGTRLEWRTTFESREQADQVRAVWDGLTEQNLDRLEAVLRGEPARS